MLLAPKFSLVFINNQHQFHNQKCYQDVRSSNATPVLKQCQSVPPVLMQDTFHVCVGIQINPNHHNVKVQLFYRHRLFHIWGVVLLSSDRAEGSSSYRWSHMSALHTGRVRQNWFWEIHVHESLHFKYFAQMYNACTLNIAKHEGSWRNS